MDTIPTGWKVYKDMAGNPTPNRNWDYCFFHTDHDGTNGLCGNGSSVGDCIAQIKEKEDTGIV